jgi:CheY-like chemotaxis protein
VTDRRFPHVTIADLDFAPHLRGALFSTTPSSLRQFAQIDPDPRDPPMRPARPFLLGGGFEETSRPVRVEAATGRASENTEPLSSLRILLVEDDEVSRDVALLMLQHLGCRADVAVNGTDALVAVQRAPYDVALMDVQMPEMDGLEATIRIRRDLPPSHQPFIVAMTANCSAVDQETYRNVGMDSHLSKPISIAKLADTLRAYGARPGSLPLKLYEPEAAPLLAPPVTAGSEEPPSERPVVYDPAVLDDLIEQLGADGADLRVDLVEAYLSDSDERITALTAAGREGNREALAFTAHALKSASATVGLMALAETARVIETAARDASHHLDVAVEASALIAEYRRAIAALSAERRGH